MLSLKINLLLLLLAVGYPALMLIRDRCAGKNSVALSKKWQFIFVVFYAVIVCGAFFLVSSFNSSNKEEAFLLECEVEAQFPPYLMVDGLVNIETKLCIPFVEELIEKNKDIRQVGFQVYEHHFRVLLKGDKNISADKLHKGIQEAIASSKFIDPKLYRQQRDRITPHPMLVRVPFDFEFPDEYDAPYYNLIVHSDRMAAYDVSRANIRDALVMAVPSGTGILSVKSDDFDKTLDQPQKLWESLSNVRVKDNILLRDVAEIKQTSMRISRPMYTVAEFKKMADGLKEKRGNLQQ
ncbi:MAG: hypothetical protein WC695_09345 [Candidatus Omnitrophota bacterium]